MFVNHLIQGLCYTSEQINNIEEQTIKSTAAEMVFTHRLIEIAVWDIQGRAVVCVRRRTDVEIY